jgi:hypothetical protein
MSGHVPCFMVVPTDRYRIKLRRYSFRDARPCSAPGAYGHDASVVVGEDVRTETHPIVNRDDPERYPHDDPRWPTACARCGAAVDPSDEWQVFAERLYVRADGGGGEHVLRELPAGAMYDATWLLDMPDMRGPDGRSLHVRLPDGFDWGIDCPAKGGGHWTRSGEAPRITARPSILTPGYHGWLTDGVLTPC